MARVTSSIAGEKHAAARVSLARRRMAALHRVSTARSKSARHAWRWRHIVATRRQQKNRQRHHRTAHMAARANAAQNLKRMAAGIKRAGSSGIISRQARRQRRLA